MNFFIFFKNVVMQIVSGIFFTVILVKHVMFPRHRDMFFTGLLCLLMYVRGIPVMKLIIPLGLTRVCGTLLSLAIAFRPRLLMSKSLLMSLLTILSFLSFFAVFMTTWIAFHHATASLTSHNVAMGIFGSVVAFIPTYWYWNYAHNLFEVNM